MSHFPGIFCFIICTLVQPFELVNKNYTCFQSMYLSYYNWPFLWCWSVDAFASICVFLVTHRANVRLRHILALAPVQAAVVLLLRWQQNGTSGEAGGSSFQGHFGILWRHPKSTSWDSNLPPLTLIYVSWFQRTLRILKIQFGSEIHFLVWQPWECCSLWPCFSWLVLQHNSSEPPSICLEEIDAPTGHHPKIVPPHSKVAALLLPQVATEGKFEFSHIVWKLPKMSQFNFWILAFSTNFCPIKTDLSGNTVWPQASGFQKLAKMANFWHF